jgi:hypothetical protein
MTRRLPIEELVDRAHLPHDGQPPSPRAIRAALPAGWLLEPDGRTARRDLRALARQGWLLLLALVVFGSVVLGLFWSSFPRGGAGLARLGILLALVLIAGRVVAPLITRALHRR